MKFRMFTENVNGRKIAVNVDRVRHIQIGGRYNEATEIWMDGHGEDAVVIEVKEDFDTVFSRLNTIAE